MRWRDRWTRWRRSATGRYVLFLLGWLLVLLSPVAGLLPGPGGVFVFAGGATLLLQTSFAARRVYVRIERRWPTLGRLGNKALRRHRERARH